MAGIGEVVISFIDKSYSEPACGASLLLPTNYQPILVLFLLIKL